MLMGLEDWWDNIHYHFEGKMSQCPEEGHLWCELRGSTSGSWSRGALEPLLRGGAEAETSLAREQHPTSTKCYLSMTSPRVLISVTQQSSQSVKGLV